MHMLCEVVTPPVGKRVAARIALVALVALGAAYGVSLHNRHVYQRAVDTQRRAYRQAWRFAVVAYERWVRDHSSGGCPETFTELRRYATDRSPIDPWGGVFEMVCEPTLLRVHSPGPDGVFGTADDVERTAPR